MEAPDHEEGVLFYDDQQKAFSYYNEKDEVEINLAKEEVIRVKNDAGEALPNGTPVFISGASGVNPLIDKAKASDSLANRTIGLTTEHLDKQEIGYVTTQGDVRNLDTSEFSEGDEIYVDPGGGLQNTEPDFPNERTRVGFCMRSNPSNGVIYVFTEPNGKRSYVARGEPADPPNGEAFEWVSNGDGAGEDGDYMIKITDSSGTTKVATVVDFSSV